MGTKARKNTIRWSSPSPVTMQARRQKQHRPHLFLSIQVIQLSPTGLHLIEIQYYICHVVFLCWAGVIREEKTRLIIFAVARIHRTRLLATLSGLKLEAEITSLHSSLTCRKKIRPLSLEYSVTGQVGRTMIVLLEGVAPNQQFVLVSFLAAYSIPQIHYIFLKHGSSLQDCGQGYRWQISSVVLEYESPFKG